MTNAAAHPWVKARTMCRDLTPILVELAEQNEGQWVAIVQSDGWSFVTREAYTRMMNAVAEYRDMRARFETSEGAGAIAQAVNLKPETVQRVIDQMLATARPTAAEDQQQARAAG